MAGYIGVDGIARKIKNMYIGVENVAKKAKKAYIGVNGVARLWYALAQGLQYAGTATALSAPRKYLAATAVGDYALFGGGYDGGQSNVVDAYTVA